MACLAGLHGAVCSLRCERGCGGEGERREGEREREREREGGRVERERVVRERQ